MHAQMLDVRIRHATCSWCFVAFFRARRNLGVRSVSSRTASSGIHPGLEAFDKKGNGALMASSLARTVSLRVDAHSATPKQFFHRASRQAGSQRVPAKRTGDESGGFEQIVG